MPTYRLPPPDVRYLTSENRFVLLSDYRTPEVIVPCGFKTDGASVPRILQNIFPVVYKYFPACIVHDYMYSGILANTKKQADDLFNVNLQRLKISSWYRIPMVAAVRLFGGPNFKGKKIKK